MLWRYHTGGNDRTTKNPTSRLCCQVSVFIELVSTIDTLLADTILYVFIVQMSGRLFQEMRKQRTIVGLEELLMRLFDQPNARLEREVIQSDPFRKIVLTRWATWCLKENRVLDSRGILTLPVLCPINSKLLNAELSWLIERITRGPAELDGGLAAFPSRLSRTGPQYPFTYSEFDHLGRRAGDLKGTEMTKPIQVVPRALRRIERERDIAVYKWKVEDDDDKFVDDPLNPKSVKFYPNSY